MKDKIGVGESFKMIVIQNGKKQVYEAKPKSKSKDDEKKS